MFYVGWIAFFVALSFVIRFVYVKYLKRCLRNRRQQHDSMGIEINYN